MNEPKKPPVSKVDTSNFEPQQHNVLAAAKAVDEKTASGHDVDGNITMPFTPKDWNEVDISKEFADGGSFQPTDAPVGHTGPEAVMPKVSPNGGKVVGLKSISAGVNPKDRVGASKVDLTLIPPAAKIHMALALMDGATKYGEYNWRVEPIQARTYISAIERHMMDFLDSEDAAGDSGIKHLGHIMACCAILIDAGHQGTLVDDRPVVNAKAASAPVLLDVANDWIKRKPAGWGRS